MQLILVRHAEPVRIDASSNGPADPPLSDVGLLHAERVAAWLAPEDIDHVVTSPLRRARETADPLARRLAIEPELVEGIGEFDRRDASYIPFEEMTRDDAKFAAMVEERWTDVEGWMDPEEFRVQVVGSIEDVVQRFPGGRVVIFTHGGVINTYLAHVLGAARTLFFYPGYTSIHRVQAARTGERSILSVNDTAHLDSRFAPGAPLDEERT